MFLVLDTNVTGLSYYDAKKFTDQIEIGTQLELKKDPSNVYDGNAVATYFKGEKIGWIPKAVNEKLRGHREENLTAVVYRADWDTNKIWQSNLRVYVYAFEEKDFYDNAEILKVTVKRNSRPYIVPIMLPLRLKEMQSTGRILREEKPEKAKPEVLRDISNAPYGKLTYRENPCMEIPLEGCGNKNIQEQLEWQKQLEQKMALNYTTKIEKETKVSNVSVDRVLNTNKTVAENAAYLEAGRIAGNQINKFVSAKAPLMIKGYVDTPFGKLLTANAAAMAAAQFRPNDQRLARLTNAMMTVAWQEVYQSFDIETFIDEMISNASIQAALKNMDTPE